MVNPFIPGSALPRLAYEDGDGFDWQQFQPLGFGLLKPSGGLWTSPLTYDDDFRVSGSAWTQWQDDNMSVCDNPPTLTEIIPEPDARVFVIDTVNELEWLIECHPDPEPVMPFRVRAPIDWLSAAKAIDAVWLTRIGEIRTRFSDPSLYGWDCSTVFWLNPAFTVGEPITIGKVLE